MTRFRRLLQSRAGWGPRISSRPGSSPAHGQPPAPPQKKPSNASNPKQIKLHRARQDPLGRRPWEINTSQGAKYKGFEPDTLPGLTSLGALGSRRFSWGAAAVLQVPQPGARPARFLFRTHLALWKRPVHLAELRPKKTFPGGARKAAQTARAERWSSCVFCGTRGGEGGRRAAPSPPHPAGGGRESRRG